MTEKTLVDTTLFFGVAVSEKEIVRESELPFAFYFVTLYT